MISVIPAPSHPPSPPAGRPPVPFADVPLRRVVAGVRVGMLPGRGFVINPTVQEMEER